MLNPSSPNNMLERWSVSAKKDWYDIDLFHRSLRHYHQTEIYTTATVQVTTLFVIHRLFIVLLSRVVQCILRHCTILWVKYVLVRFLEGWIIRYFAFGDWCFDNAMLRMNNQIYYVVSMLTISNNKLWYQSSCVYNRIINYHSFRLQFIFDFNINF